MVTGSTEHWFTFLTTDKSLADLKEEKKHYISPISNCFQKIQIEFSTNLEEEIALSEGLALVELHIQSRELTA